MENLASNISIQHLFVNSNTIFEFFDNLSCINLLCFYQNIAFNKKTIASTYRFILPYRFFVVSEMQTACWETLHSRLLLLDKTEKVTHFRRFFKKKALHNCIICAVQLWLREPDLN